MERLEVFTAHHCPFTKEGNNIDPVNKYLSFTGAGSVIAAIFVGPIAIFAWLAAVVFIRCFVKDLEGRPHNSKPQDQHSGKCKRRK